MKEFVPWLLQRYRELLAKATEGSQLYLMIDAHLMRAQSLWYGWPAEYNPWRVARLSARRRKYADEETRVLPRRVIKHYRQDRISRYLLDELIYRDERPEIYKQDNVGCMDTGDIDYYEGTRKPSRKGKPETMTPWMGREIVTLRADWRTLSFYDPDKRMPRAGAIIV